VLLHVRDVERGLRGEKEERLQQFHLLRREAQRTHRMQAVEGLLHFLQHGDELRGFLVA